MSNPDETKSPSLAQVEAGQAYKADLKQFEPFLTPGKSTVDAFRAFAAWLEGEWAAGRYSATTFNRKVAAVRGVLRRAFQDGVEAEELHTHYQLDEVLREVRWKKVEPLSGLEEVALTPEEVKTLISEAKDPKVRLMIAFLVGTGVRISEMLALKMTDLVATEFGFSEARVVGKGRRERVVHVKALLLERIQKTFSGTTFLFEHDGQPYNRVSVTNRIKYEALRTIGREVSAQQLRHTWAMIQIQRGRNLKAVARNLGHADSAPALRAVPDGALRPDEAFLEVPGLDTR